MQLLNFLNVNFIEIYKLLAQLVKDWAFLDIRCSEQKLSILVSFLRVKRLEHIFHCLLCFFDLFIWDTWLFWLFWRFFRWEFFSGLWISNTRSFSDGIFDTRFLRPEGFLTLSNFWLRFMSRQLWWFRNRHFKNPSWLLQGTFVWDFLWNIIWYGLITLTHLI